MVMQPIIQLSCHFGCWLLQLIEVFWFFSVRNVDCRSIITWCLCTSFPDTHSDPSTLIQTSVISDCLKTNFPVNCSYLHCRPLNLHILVCKFKGIIQLHTELQVILIFIKNIWVDFVIIKKEIVSTKQNEWSHWKINRIN